MREWQFEITPEAEEDLERLDKSIQNRVTEKLEWLVKNFANIVPLPLGNNWRGFFKMRVGNWRIIYEVDELERKVIIHAIGRRDKIYKRKIKKP